MRTVVKTLTHPNGKRRVLIIYHGGDRYGLDEEYFSDDPLERCWCSCGSNSSSFFDSRETAEREARGRIAWLTTPGATATKDPSVLDVLARLNHALGSGFRIDDHWESDLCAVRIASPTDAGVLVYVSTWKQPPARYAYECEVPTPATGNAATEYSVVERGEAVDFDELVAAIRRHFARA